MSSSTVPIAPTDGPAALHCEQDPGVCSVVKADPESGFLCSQHAAGNIGTDWCPGSATFAPLVKRSPLPLEPIDESNVAEHLGGNALDPRDGRHNRKERLERGEQGSVPRPFGVSAYDDRNRPFWGFPYAILRWWSTQVLRLVPRGGAETGPQEVG